jgi:hypothetical protein
MNRDTMLKEIRVRRFSCFRITPLLVVVLDELDLPPAGHRDSAKNR